MKKILILLLLLLPFHCSSQAIDQWVPKKIAVTYAAGGKWNKNSVKVDRLAAGYWKALCHLYEVRGIKIDYTKIKSVKLVNKKEVGWVGLYDPYTRTIFLNAYVYESIVGVNHTTMMILILAHEMGHSQGKNHSWDKTSIMYPAAVYIKQMLEDGILVSELAMTPYTKG